MDRKNYNLWTQDEIIKLEKICNSNDKMTLEELTKEFPRHTKDSIKKKCKTNNLQYKFVRRMTKKELMALQDLWERNSTSLKSLSKKYGVTKESLSAKAYNHNWGPKETDEGHLTIKYISEEMNVSQDIIRGWLHRGLKHLKHRSGKMYIIREEDLLDYLENHKDEFDASKLSEYIFPVRPNWLKDKIKEDKLNRYKKENRFQKYSIYEENLITELFNKGKTDIEIAKILDRSETGIKIKRQKMNLYRR